MTVFRLSPQRTVPTTTSFVVGRSFVVGVRGAQASVLSALDALRDREHVAAEELMARVPISASGIDDLLIVTVEGEREATAQAELIGEADAHDLSSVSARERRISVLARGALAVDVYSIGGSRRFGAGGIRPFVLAEFREVTAFAILSEGDQTMGASAFTTRGAALPPGIVEAEGLAWAQGDGLHEETQLREPVEESTVLLRRGTQVPAAFGDTVISLPASTLPPELEETTLRQVVDVIAAMEVPESAEVSLVESFAPPADDVQDTILSGADRFRPEKLSPLLRRAEPREPPRAAAPEVYPVFRLGQRSPEALEGILFLGRNPRVPRVPSGRTIGLRVLDSPTHAVSGTHASLERSGSTIVVTDLGSSNGTIVELPGVPARRLRAGESVTLPPSSRVDLGDDNVIHVLSPAPAYSALDSGDNS